MPSYATSPRAAFMTAADMREWSGVQVMTISVTPVTLPTISVIYEDIIHHLNGYGSRPAATIQILSTLLSAAWTASGAGGTMSAGLNSDDTFYVRVDGGAAIDFEIEAHANNAQLGFDAAGHGLVGGATPFIRNATAQWQRGNLIGARLRINPTGAPAAFTVTATMLQNAITWLRSQNQGDVDAQNASNSLERAVQDAMSIPQFRCGITTLDAANNIPPGHVYFAMFGGMPAPAWDSTTYRDRLGFSGNEALETIGGQSILIADYPCPGVWAPSRPLRRLQPWHDEKTAALDQRGGGISSNRLSRKTGWNVEAWAGGVSSLRAFGTRRYAGDDEAHLRDNFWSLCQLGGALTLFPELGDTRRQIYRYQVKGTQAGYDLKYTVEDRHGRRRCLRDSADVVLREVEYEHDILLRMLQAVRLRDRVD